MLNTQVRSLEIAHGHRTCLVSGLCVKVTKAVTEWQGGYWSPSWSKSGAVSCRSVWVCPAILKLLLGFVEEC